MAVACLKKMFLPAISSQIFQNSFSFMEDEVEAQNLLQGLT